MSGPQARNGQLREGGNYPSPFTRVIAFGYYDGPTEGVAQCGPGGDVYAFRLLDGDEVRVYRLALLPSSAFDRLVAILGPCQAPRWPVWVPLWNFPSEEIRQAVERETEQVLAQAGPVAWVLACGGGGDLLGTILVARPMTPEVFGTVTDWLSYLGLEESAQPDGSRSPTPFVQ